LRATRFKSKIDNRKSKIRRQSRRSLGEGGRFFGLLHFSRELRLGTPVMKQFFYVYILQSALDPLQFYTGLTDDLRTRLKITTLAALVTQPNGSRGE